MAYRSSPNRISCMDNLDFFFADDFFQNYSVKERKKEKLFGDTRGFRGLGDDGSPFIFDKSVMTLVNIRTTRLTGGRFTLTLCNINLVMILYMYIHMPSRVCAVSVILCLSFSLPQKTEPLLLHIQATIV